jgi:outer membrane receptor protein involved in Fe transport
MIERLGPRTSALALVMAALLFGAPLARADERAQARRHFREGMDLVHEGKYDEGIRELTEAYRIVPHPAVLYNIGRAYFAAGQFDRAIEELQHYADTDPPDREDVMRLIEVARARLREEERSQAVDAPAPVEPPPRRDPERSEEIANLRKQLNEVLDRMEKLEGAADPGPGPARAEADAARRGPSTTTGGGGAGEKKGAEAPAAAEAVVARGDGADAVDPYAPIVITSSRYGQSPLDAPNSVTILTGDELRASGVSAIPDFLRRVPGVEIMAMSAGDYNIGIRGFNDRLANRVLVLVDGRSIYFDNVGANFWPFLHISLADVERIEVVRGPGAALYGANAFSGVINIITRSPGLSGNQPVAELWGGLPDQGGASLRLTDRLGSTAYRASASFEQKRRWYREIDPARTDYVVLPDHPDDSVRVGRFDLRLDHRVGRRASVSLSGGMAGGQHEFAASGALRDFYLDGFASYLRGDVQLPQGISVRSFWTRVDVNADQWARPVGGLSIATDLVTDVVDTEIESFRQVDFFGVVQRINVGAGYRFKSTRWNWLGSEPEEHHVSAFFQDEAVLADNLHAIFSLRLDRHPLLAAIDDAAFTDKYAVSPRGALVWRVVPEGSLHATIGTAFRTPTFLESYVDTPFPTTTDAVVVQNIGNQALLPERMLATEVGWRSEPASSLYTFEAAAYYNRISSLIQLSELRPWPADVSNYDPAAGVWYAGVTNYDNVNQDYNAFGMELGGKLLPADGIDLYANAAFERVSQGGTAIKSTSPVKLSAGAQVHREGFTFGGDLHFVSAQTWGIRSFDETGQTLVTDVELPAYVWAGARVSYLIPDSRLEVAIAGQNLLAPLQPAVEPVDGDMSQVTTPKGTHREHPLGQPIPASVFATLTYQIW